MIGDGGQAQLLSPYQQALVAATPVDGKPRTVDLGDGLGAYRVAALPSPDDGDVLVTGLPLRTTQEALLRLIAVEVVVGVIGLLAAAVVGFVIIRRTLQPLHRVAQTATRVSELELSSGEVQMAERVPAADTDPHTEVGQVGSALNQLLDHVESSLSARQASETRCGSSSPMPATSSAHRSPRSAAMPNSCAAGTTACPRRWATPCGGWSRRRSA